MCIRDRPAEFLAWRLSVPSGVSGAVGFLEVSERYLFQVLDAAASDIDVTRLVATQRIQLVVIPEDQCLSLRLIRQ